MAIATPTNLLSNQAATSASTYTTAAASFASGSLYLLFLMSNRASDTDPTGVTSPSNSWQKIGTGKTWDNQGTLTRNISAWWCISAATVSEAVTINFGVATNSVIWSLNEVASGFDATPIGDYDVGGSDVNSVSGTVPTLTLQDSGSMVFSAWSHRVQEATNPKGGWFELSDLSPASTRCLEVQYGVNDPDASASWTTTNGWAGIAAEIQASAGGPPTSVTGVQAIALS